MQFGENEKKKDKLRWTCFIAKNRGTVLGQLLKGEKKKKKDIRNYEKENCGIFKPSPSSRDRKAISTKYGDKTSQSYMYVHDRVGGYV